MFNFYRSARKKLIALINRFFPLRLCGRKKNFRLNVIPPQKCIQSLPTCGETLVLHQHFIPRGPKSFRWLVTIFASVVLRHYPTLTMHVAGI
jgi:hypothetical protein